MSSALLELTFSSQCVVCFPSNRSSNVTTYKSIMQFGCHLGKPDKLEIHSLEKDQEKSWLNRYTEFWSFYKGKQSVYPSIKEG